MLLRAATETALELKSCMNINLSCDMKTEEFIMQGIFIDWLLLQKLLRLSYGSWACCILSDRVAGSEQTALVNAGCPKTWADLCLSLCYWMESWHDQGVITVTLHCPVGGKGLSCKVKRGDGQTLHYIWHVWEGQSWKDFRESRSWGRAIGKPRYQVGRFWSPIMVMGYFERHQLRILSFILLFHNLLQHLKQLEKAASGIQW